MLIGIDTTPLYPLTEKEEYVQLQNDIKIVRTLRLIFFIKLNFLIFSVFESQLCLIALERSS